MSSHCWVPSSSCKPRSPFALGRAALITVAVAWCKDEWDQVQETPFIICMQVQTARVGAFLLQECSALPPCSALPHPSALPPPLHPQPGQGKAKAWSEQTSAEAARASSQGC